MRFSKAVRQTRFGLSIIAALIALLCGALAAYAPRAAREDHEEELAAGALPKPRSSADKKAVCINIYELIRAESQERPFVCCTAKLDCLTFVRFP
jgi:hypothetical protein